MTPFDRIIWTVLDSVGIGALPDAAAYGDTACNTLGNKPTSGTEILIDGEVCCLG
jgi:phosphopentomutase